MSELVLIKSPSVYQSPAVAEVGVAGVPDPTRGEVVKAWVVLREGEQVGEEELRAWAKERLAPYKVPKRIEFRGTLPKSMAGKVLRNVSILLPFRRPQCRGPRGCCGPSVMTVASPRNQLYLD
jgi:hypothetical protein